MFFSDTAGSMSSSVRRVFRSHGVLEFSCFVATHHCLTCFSHMHFYSQTGKTMNTRNISGMLLCQSGIRKLNCKQER